MRALRGAAGRSLSGVLAAAALALGSCDGSDDSDPAAAAGAFDPAQPARQLRCSDWNDASPAARREIIERMRDFVGGPVVGEGVSGRGTVLAHDQAYSLFETRCRDAFAESFLLTKLYGHAASFAGEAP